MDLIEWKKKVTNDLRPVCNKYDALNWWVKNIDTYVRQENDIPEYVGWLKDEINRVREALTSFDNSLPKEKKNLSTTAEEGSYLFVVGNILVEKN